jgi:hypothetical protein
MARLPIPGSDDGTWGQVLNGFLGVAHDSDGTLKADAVDASSIQDNSITNVQLDSGSGSDGQILTKDTASSGGFKWTSASASSPATSSSLGTVQLAGDLGGVATAPTVPALANKANTSTTITAGTGLSGGGDLSANRTLAVTYGVISGTAAQGNDSRITGAEQTANKNVAGGYAPLNGSAQVPLANLPLPLAQSNTHASADTDSAPTALHHTLGTGANQAAAGNHTHTLTFSLTSFFKTGALTVTTGTQRLPIDGAYTIVGTRLMVGTAPTGANLIVDVNKNGTTIYTTQGNRPSVVATQNAGGPGTTPDVTALVAGDYLTVDIDQIGSTIAGSDLTVSVIVSKIV